MTHPLVSRFRRPLAGLAALGALALGLALVAGPASAAPLHFAPETFTIQFDNSPIGHGFATGPVRGGFTDFSQTPTADLFSFGFPAGRVEVEHSAVAPPRLDPRSCTGFAYVAGSWRMNGLTGRDADAIGFGHFAAWEFASAPRERHHHGGCDVRDEQLTVYVSASGEAANPHSHY
jgi:hypothetical protein